MYTTEKSLKDYGDKVPAEDKANIEKELASLKAAIEAKDQDKIKSSMESLQKVSHKLAEEMYKATSAQPQGAPGADGGAQPNDAAGPQGGSESSGESKPNDDVIDADFKATDKK